MINSILLASSIILMFYGVHITLELLDTRKFLYVAGFLKVNAIMSIFIGMIIALSTIFGFKATCFETCKANYIVFGFSQFTAVTATIHLIFVIANKVYFGEDVTIVRSLYIYDLSDDIWNRMQKKYECCGIDGYQDYEKIPFGRIPDSCSKNGQLTFQKGCQEAFIGVIESYFYILASFTALSIVLSILNSIISLKIARKNQKKNVCC